MNLVIRGRGRYLMSDRRHDLVPGSLVWLFPDQDHVLIDESPDFAMWIVVWRQRLVRRTCIGERYALLRQRNPSGDLTKALPAAVAKPLGEMLGNMPPIEDPVRYNVALAHVLLTAWDAHGRADVGPVRSLHPAVEEATRLIRGDAEAVKLSVLAKRCGLSPSRLSRVFKRETGVSLVHFRQRMQLDRFLQQYERNADRTLLAAALDAGFGSYAQFHRVYTRAFGHGPGRSAGRRGSAIDANVDDIADIGGR